MEGSSKVFQASLSKYVEQNSGIEFYASRIDPGLSYISEDGYVNLVGKVRKEVHARYKIEEIGLTPEEINEDLKASQASGSSAPTSTRSGETISIDLSDKRKVLGLASSAIMLIGALCPVATLPIIGSINYVANGRGDGVIILVISIISAFFVLTERYKLLKYAGTVSLCLMFFTLFRFQFAISKASASMDELKDNPFTGIAQAAFNSIGLGWGWILLISGAVALLVTSSTDVVDGKLYLKTKYVVPGKGDNWKDNIGVLAILGFSVGLILAAIFQ